jgi:hypothetical protein
MGAYSKTGQINPFDDSADGYVPGEAIVAILIKPLSKAIRDKDQIYGVIKGSYVNNGGKSAGPSGPNRVEKPGAKFIGAQSGAHLIRINIEYKSHFKLKWRWDQYEIPLPFSSVQVSVTF